MSKYKKLTIDKIISFIQQTYPQFPLVELRGEVMFWIMLIIFKISQNKPSVPFRGVLKDEADLSFFKEAEKYLNLAKIHLYPGFTEFDNPFEINYVISNHEILRFFDDGPVGQKANEERKNILEEMINQTEFSTKEEEDFVVYRRPLRHTAQKTIVKKQENIQ